MADGKGVVATKGTQVIEEEKTLGKLKCQDEISGTSLRWWMDEGAFHSHSLLGCRRLSCEAH